MFPKIKQFVGKVVDHARDSRRVVPGAYSSPFNEFDLDPVEQKEVDRKLKKSSKTEE